MGFTSRTPTFPPSAAGVVQPSLLSCRRCHPAAPTPPHTTLAYRLWIITITPPGLCHKHARQSRHLCTASPAESHRLSEATRVCCLQFLLAATPCPACLSLRLASSSWLPHCSMGASPPSSPPPGACCCSSSPSAAAAAPPSAPSASMPAASAAAGSSSFTAAEAAGAGAQAGAGKVQRTSRGHEKGEHTSRPSQHRVHCGEPSRTLQTHCGCCSHTPPRHPAPF
jgi:hypothetical protein